MIKTIPTLAILAALSFNDKKCNIYDNKFMTLLHKSLLLECEKNTKNQKKCKRLLSKITYYNKLRSKHCYITDEKDVQGSKKP